MVAPVSVVPPATTRATHSPRFQGIPDGLGSETGLLPKRSNSVMQAYNAPMQTPMLVFDHVRKIAQAVATAPARKKLAELARSERNVATSGRPSK